MRRAHQNTMQMERDLFLLIPRHKGLALSLPAGRITELLRFAQGMLARLPDTRPAPDIAVELEGMGMMLHPLALLPDPIRELLEMTGRARCVCQALGIEMGGRLLVSVGLAWLEVQVWRGESLEVLCHELEEETDDEGRPDPVHRGR
ncbi:hypothetical protein Mrub_0499 [Meiothermus ruber DSM 1279]|uniref:Uncharacterized protein n=2 Tax=Meiothermus ruber (strain ATCC 35948 / DSM 1279 / VKM B-1258 / 21) TaxID=504728 RepID=A0A806DH77_MEIRD|nr:hypothetical protein Mrub_0499 [Meiothermus ruber DSM 1279]